MNYEKEGHCLSDGEIFPWSDLILGCWFFFFFLSYLIYLSSPKEILFKKRSRTFSRYTQFVQSFLRNAFLSILRPAIYVCHSLKYPYGMSNYISPLYIEFRSRTMNMTQLLVSFHEYLDIDVCALCICTYGRALIVVHKVTSEPYQKQ